MADVPATTRQIMVQKLGTNFREVTAIKDMPVPDLEKNTFLVKVKYVGINASDINLTSGRYFSDAKPPFPCGMEGIGEVVAVGEGSKFKVGQCAAFIGFGSFGEYVRVEDNRAAPVPSTDPALLSIVLSGPTASISLEKEADLKEGKTVLVTAAAGGTGMFAVQLAKLAGCTVIGTCSSPDKVDFLKSIGCDRPVNYKDENLDEVLKKEYPKGVDVVYECIGGEIFDAALNNLTLFGRLIVIGQISKYEGDELTQPALKTPESKYPIAMSMLRKSASLRGFILTHYGEDQPRHVAKLAKLFMEGKIKVVIDKGEKDPKGPFKGLEKVVDAVEYMYARKNTGKIVVEL